MYHNIYNTDKDSDCYYQVVLFLGAKCLGTEPAEKAWRVPTGFIPDCMKVTGVSTLSRKCLEQTREYKWGVGHIILHV